MESRIVWPFELLDRLGEGGMGVVYRARHIGNDRIVAVKLLPDDVATNETLVARFERELDVLKQLRHPNIIECYGGTCESKQHFYAMELVEGGTLADVLARRRRLPWETAVDYALQMCAALQYAHERGVVHRDIKPGNFMLTKTGQIKLGDFGLATVVSGSRITSAGKTLGTIQYMSPEQIRGEPPVSNRSDLYSLGCVIHEMLTGHPPYLGASSAEVLQKHLKAPIPHAAAEVSDCPLELDELIFQLLSKDASHRPESANQVASRLEGILQPGRRTKPIDPDFFDARTPKQPIVVPLEGISSSDPDLEALPKPVHRTATSLIPWAVSAVLMLGCVVLWIEMRRATLRLRQAEQIWVTLMDEPDPTVRRLALSSLSRFDSLSPATLSKLIEIARSVEQTDDMRIAALVTLASHPADSRLFQAEIYKLQNHDDNPSVREQAGRTFEILKSAGNRTRWAIMQFWFFVIALLGLAALGLRLLWKRLEKFA